MVIFLIMTIIWIPLFLISMWFEILGWQHWFFFLLSLGYTLYYYFLPVINAKRYMRHALKYHNGVIPENHELFTEQEIILRDHAGETRLSYDKFDKAQSTEHMLILTARKYMRLIVHKDCFTKGTYEEFLAFLRAKCPDLKIPE